MQLGAEKLKKLNQEPISLQFAPLPECVLSIG
jgi:hypothetical protein